MIVVTAGSKYLDIDAYACIISYSKYLKLRGNDVKAVSTASWNKSITLSLKTVGTKLDDYKVQACDEFVIVDVSNPDYFDEFIIRAISP